MRLTAVTLASLAALSLGPIPAPPRARAADLAELQARGSFRVLTTPEEYPEWFSLKESESPGFERELVEGFVKLHRMKLEIVTVPSFDAIIPALVDGRGDLICGIIDTTARRKQVAFTSEVLPSRHLAVSLRPQPASRSLAELRERKVGVLLGTTWAEVTRESIPDAPLVSFTRQEELMKALRAGRITATVVAFSEYLSQRRTTPDLEPGVLLGPRMSAAWAVRPRDVQLLKGLDAYLMLKKQSAGFTRLLVKYFGDDATALLDRAKQ